MSTQKTTMSTTINGIDASHVLNVAGKIQKIKDYGRFRFRASNRWIHGAASKTEIQSFFAGNRERTDRDKPFLVQADQPYFLGGTNTAPNSVEYLLHALTSCLTTTLAYHASVQQIEIESIQTSAEGHLNSKGFFGLSDQVAKGFERISVTMRVASRVDVDTLTGMAMNSPVFDMVSRASKVEFKLLVV